MRSTYAWIIDRDHLCEELHEPRPYENDAGRRGPWAPPESAQSELLSGGGHVFEMYDDDDQIYYTGRIAGAFDGFEPLDDFGRPNAGCTGIKYPGSGPDYGGGKYL